MLLTLVVNAQEISLSASIANADNYADQFVEPIYVRQLPPQSPPDPAWSLQKLLGAKEIDRSSCVSLAKYLRPDQRFQWIAPKYVKAYPLTPKEGLLVITSEGPVGHVAFVTSVSSTSLEIIEANYTPGIISTRSLSLENPKIRGYR